MIFISSIINKVSNKKLSQSMNYDSKFCRKSSLKCCFELKSLVLSLMKFKTVSHIYYYRVCKGGLRFTYTRKGVNNQSKSLRDCDFTIMKLGAEYKLSMTPKEESLCVKVSLKEVL